MATKRGTGRSSAPLALAGDDDSVGDFITALTTTQTQATQLSSSLQSMKSTLGSVIEVLGYPETVSQDLDNLNTVLSTASTVLTAVSIIPEISAEADIIQTAVKSLQAEIEPAKEAADAIDAEVKPVRDALTQVQSLLDQAIQAANDTASAAQTFLTNFQQINACINSLPDGPAKTQGLAYLSSFAATAEPVVDTFNTALTTVNGAISDFSNAVTEIENQLSFMSEITGAIESVLGELAPLLGPLQSLMNLLNTSITIPIVGPFYGLSVSISDILTDFQQFIDLAMQILSPVLDPILQPLEQLAQSIISQIPGIDQLLNLHIDIPGIPDFSGLFGNISSLLTQLQGVLQQFNLTCPPAANQVSFAEQLQTHMKDVSGAFAHGALYALDLGAGKRNVAASGGPVFRAELDLAKRIVFVQAGTGRILAVENGAPVLKRGPVTPASHFRVTAKGAGKFALTSEDGQVLEIAGKTEFKADRH
jgi:uncharacterized phage infection (PIP) family protein YhgE